MWFVQSYYFCWTNELHKKTSSVVNQISKIASSLVHKLKYWGADSRTWRARIVSKPSYPQFNIFFNNNCRSSLCWTSCICTCWTERSLLSLFSCNNVLHVGWFIQPLTWYDGHLWNLLSLSLLHTTPSSTGNIIL